MTITRSEVLANRWTWINFLLTKGRKKVIETLDKGKGERCCLGHGAYCLGVKKSLNYNNVIIYGAECNDSYAPKELIEKVGLWSNDGKVSEGDFIIKGINFSTLAGANDTTTVYDQDSGDDVPFNATPRDIGKYLQSVIEGGRDTPFKPLTDYPE